MSIFSTSPGMHIAAASTPGFHQTPPFQNCRVEQKLILEALITHLRRCNVANASSGKCLAAAIFYRKIKSNLWSLNSHIGVSRPLLPDYLVASQFLKILNPEDRKMIRQFRHNDKGVSINCLATRLGNRVSKVQNKDLKMAESAHGAKSKTNSQRWKNITHAAQTLGMAVNLSPNFIEGIQFSFKHQRQLSSSRLLVDCR